MKKFIVLLTIATTVATSINQPAQARTQVARPAIGPHFGNGGGGAPSGVRPPVGPHFGGGAPASTVRPPVGPHFGSGQAGGIATGPRPGLDHGTSAGGIIAAAAVTAVIVTGAAIIAAENR